MPSQLSTQHMTKPALPNLCAMVRREQRLIIGRNVPAIERQLEGAAQEGVEELQERVSVLSTETGQRNVDG
jgi:hypothetical protein